MKKLSKILILGAVMACLLICSSTAFAAYKSCGENLTCDFDSTTGTLSISSSSEGAMTNFTAISATPWYGDKSLIRKVIIGSGVTNIGDNAFAGCDNLSEVSISNSVKSIGNSSFNNCDALSTITIPTSVTSIGVRAFAGCDNITTVTIPDSVKSIGYGAFSDCKRLSTVSLGKGVTIIENNAFDKCESLLNVIIKDLSAWCNINFAGEKANPVYFSKSLTLNNAKLTAIDLPASLTAISNYAFAGMTTATSISIPDSVKSIGKDTFKECAPTLKLICTENSYAFDFLLGNSSDYVIVDKKTNIAYPDHGPCGDGLYWRLNGYGGFTIGGNGKMPDYTFNTSKHTTTAPWFALRNNIKSIVLRSGVTSIGKYAFYNCSNLSGLTIPHTIKDINDNAFMECGSLLSAIIPDSTSYLGHKAFANCRKLHSITIGNNVLQLFADTFAGCSSLTSVNIPNYNSLISIEAGAFADCPADLKLSCYENGYVYNYAVKNNIKTYLIPAPSGTVATPTNPSTSTGETHTIKFDTSGGTKIADQNIANGAKVSRPANPSKSGFAFEGWYVDKTYKISYSFDETVTKDITLYAKWRTVTSGGEEWINPFHDISASDWFYNSVQFVVTKKYFNGVTLNEFKPKQNLTRAMLVTVLYRMQNNLSVSGKAQFTDVAPHVYYHDAVLWAQKKGVVNGVTATEFAPDASVTREQLATIMYRYAKVCNYKTSVSGKKLTYADAGKVSSYAVEAMIWADEIGLIKGKTATTINPKDTATRAEVATIITRFVEKFIK